MLFFVMQKTAYEMRISDWSSDLCSSDLNGSWLLPPQRALWVPSWFDHESVARKSGALKTLPLNGDDSIVLPRTVQLLTMSSFFRAVLIEALREIGRASCRERVCQYV